MGPKEKIIEVIKTLGLRLQGHNISWLVGGSASLLVHGLDVTPNDVDVVVDPQDYEKAKEALKDLLTGETIPHGNTLKTPYKINDISGDLLAYPIDKSLLTTISLEGVDVSVYKLEVEYGFYKSRTDKIEANREKIELIEKALGMSK